MTEDHELKLDALAEKLADTFLVEADPDEWRGAGQRPKELDKDTRGDRHWDLKNANQVGLLFARALELRARVRWARQAAKGILEPDAPDPSEGRVTDPEADIARFEREAARVMERLGARGVK